MKPMLAATLDDMERIVFPVYASPKLDGIRALTYNGQIVSRTLKPIPNRFVQEMLKDLPDSLDGELIVGKPEAADCFRATTSGVMSEDGEPDFKFYIFDKWDVSYTFEERQRLLDQFFKTQKKNKWLYRVTQTKLHDTFTVHEYEQIMLQRGFEGVMLRSGAAKYKFGRSTVREQGLMKLKQFADSEAKVLALVEQFKNTNEKKMNELGKMKRSSHKAGKVGKNTLGALKVQDIHTGVQFEIGTGLDDETRAKFWGNPKLILGKTVKYKYFPTGSKDKPRFPVYIGIRDARDM